MRNGEGKARKLRSRAGSTIRTTLASTALYLERTSTRPVPQGTAIRTPDHRHRPDWERTSRPVIGITSIWPSEYARGFGTRRNSPSSFRSHPIQETGKRPTAGLDRNLAYLGLVEVLYGYPLDGVVFTTGAIKPRRRVSWRPRPSTVPPSCCPADPCSMDGRRANLTGSGTVVWKARLPIRSGRDRRCRIHSTSSPRRRRPRSLQHDGDRLDHELLS